MIRKAQPAARVDLRRSGGGVFEITVDGRLAYSKKATGRFPTDQEVVDALGTA
jgi:selT/selW/selH-like putative selenoprotein